MAERNRRETTETKIPILKIDDFLIASIQVELDDSSMVLFQNDLLSALAKTGARGVVADITVMDVVDSFMARSLNDVAVAVHLLGAQMVIVGMQPALAVTLVEMGLTIPNAWTALDLERGLRILRSGQFPQWGTANAEPAAPETAGEQA
ncbi:MAG: STAS domain-containing protein [Deltaproteobacteria bacterium]|nr:STAS domain-containing protein [Deltaproteobacteria bacterium]